MRVLPKTMLALFLAASAAVFTFAQEAAAQSLDMCVTPVADKEPAFGEYGYKHMELENFGSVDNLVEKESKRRGTEVSCCDKKGECRETDIIWQSPTSLFKHGGLWCPLTAYIHTDVMLPPGMKAMVCASPTVLGECPASTYCAAMVLLN